jgi:hypothetical protein
MATITLGHASRRVGWRSTTTMTTRPSAACDSPRRHQKMPLAGSAGAK